MRVALTVINTLISAKATYRQGVSPNPLKSRP
jgi:hypothetical protein